MQIYVHARLHTYMHELSHTHVHTYLHIRLQTYAHTHIHKRQTCLVILFTEASTGMGGPPQVESLSADYAPPRALSKALPRLLFRALTMKSEPDFRSFVRGPFYTIRTSAKRQHFPFYLVPLMHEQVHQLLQLRISRGSPTVLILMITRPSIKQPLTAVLSGSCCGEFREIS